MNIYELTISISQIYNFKIKTKVFHTSASFTLDAKLLAHNFSMKSLTSTLSLSYFVMPENEQFTRACL